MTGCLGEEAFAGTSLATGRGYWRADSSERCWRKRRGLAGLDDAISRRAQPGERTTGGNWAIGGLAGNVAAGEVPSESSAERAEGWRSVSRDESTSLIHGSAGLGCASWLDDDTGTGRRARATATGRRRCTRARICYAITADLGRRCYCHWIVNGRIHSYGPGAAAAQTLAAICLFHLQVERCLPGESTSASRPR